MTPDTEPARTEAPAPHGRMRRISVAGAAATALVPRRGCRCLGRLRHRERRWDGLRLVDQGSVERCTPCDAEAHPDDRRRRHLRRRHHDPGQGLRRLHPHDRHVQQAPSTRTALPPARRLALYLHAEGAVDANGTSLDATLIEKAPAGRPGGPGGPGGRGGPGGLGGLGGRPGGHGGPPPAGAKPPTGAKPPAAGQKPTATS